METVEIKDMPKLDNNAIHVWSIFVPGIRGRLDELQAILSEGEREKALRFRREADQQASIAARGALRILLEGYTGIPAADVRFSYNGNGKPFLDFHGDDAQGDHAVSFNISHSDDWVVLVFGQDRELGVDIERIQKKKDIFGIAERFFSPEEQELIRSAENPHIDFFGLWARKEARLKALGSGIFRGLDRFPVPLVGGSLPEVAEKDGWYFYAFDSGPSYASAIVSDRPARAIMHYDFGELNWAN